MEEGKRDIKPITSNSVQRESGGQEDWPVGKEEGRVGYNRMGARIEAFREELIKNFSLIATRGENILPLDKIIGTEGPFLVERTKDQNFLG